MNEKNVKPAIIIRDINAACELVFEAWTQVEHLNQWMFPMAGCTCEFVSANIENGGRSLHKVTMPNGHEMWLLTKYIEVSHPHKLSFLQYMSNQQGEIIEMKHMPNWPRDMLATLSFESRNENTTRLEFRWEPQNPTAEEAEAFIAAQSDSSKGWGAGMDQLENYLATL